MSTTSIDHDVVVVGAGGAGLRAAIAAHDAGVDTGIVTKLHPVRSHTGSAEGGINATLRAGTVEDHVADTVKGSDYLGDVPGIELLCAEAPREVLRTEHWGMPFSREEDGRIGVRPLAGHASPRTAYAGAETGHHLLQTLYQQTLRRGIAVHDERFVTRLAVADGRCVGVVAYDLRSGDLVSVRARGGVILATGGLGQVYEHTTNAVSSTGDGAAMAYRAGVPLQDMEFVQFHPTTLPSTGVLISEAVRGEGGRLFNAEGERFMFERGYATGVGELASRDVVSRAELSEVEAGRGIDGAVHLDMRHLGERRIRDRMDHLVGLAADFEGVDAVTEPIPVRPGQHYAMGGVETDEHGRTAIEGLYAAGECACVSVHGANRLGGNAIPELLVFGSRAGRHAAGDNLGPARIEVGGGENGWDARGSHTAADGGRGGTTVDAETVLDDALEAERERIERLRGGTRSHVAVRERIQAAMADGANVFRTEAGLTRARDELRSAREAYRSVGVGDRSETFNQELIAAIETRNLLDVAEAIVLGALARAESRGGHWRRDHPDRDDDGWLAHTMVSWNDGEPELWNRPIVLEGETGTYVPTERSY